MALNSGKSIVGRDWLVALCSKITQPIEKGECEIIQQSVNSSKTICEISPEEKQSPEIKQLMGDFPKLFRDKGRVKEFEIKVNVKSEARITQEKVHTILFQLQEQIDKKIEKLLKEGHIEKVDKIQDDVFIQPTVIAVKKDKSVKIAPDARALNQSIAKDKY